MVVRQWSFFSLALPWCDFLHIRHWFHHCTYPHSRTQEYFAETERVWAALEVRLSRWLSSWQDIGSVQRGPPFWPPRLGCNCSFILITFQPSLLSKTPLLPSTSVKETLRVHLIRLFDFLLSSVRYAGHCNERINSRTDCISNWKSLKWFTSNALAQGYSVKLKVTGYSSRLQRVRPGIGRARRRP